MIGRLVIAIVLASTFSADGQDHIKKLVVASNMKHPPFSSWDKSKKPTGIEVDIVRMAAKKLDMEVEFVERPFGELFDLIAADEIDVAVSTIGRTKDRAMKVAFSNPYYSTKIVALVKPDSEYQTLDDLESKRIGADKSTTSYSAAKAKLPNSVLLPTVVDGLTWPQMIYQEKIDAFIVDASDKERLEDESGLELRQIELPLANESFCVALEKGNPRLLDSINEAVERLKPTVSYRIGNTFQFETKLGRRVYSTANPPAKLVNDYFEAKANHNAKPSDADAQIWYGRRAGYLLRMDEAIDIFSKGIKQHPADPRMYRHRGHRYISTRQFDKAITDLEKAVKLIEGQADRVEPDGAPNPQGIPLTTTHGNIWYHLGLAYYLKGDLNNALCCYNQRVALEKYDDNKVANSHWKFMILRRLKKTELAFDVVKDITPEMAVIENMSYHKMCLFYNKSIDIPTDKLTSDGDSGTDVLLYGVGNWYLYDQNDRETARTLFQRLFETGSPFSFAYIAAESDFVRLFCSDGE